MVWESLGIPQSELLELLPATRGVPYVSWLVLSPYSKSKYRESINFPTKRRINSSAKYRLNIDYVKMLYVVYLNIIIRKILKKHWQRWIKSHTKEQFLSQELEINDLILPSTPILAQILSWPEPGWFGGVWGTPGHWATGQRTEVTGINMWPLNQDS